MPRSPVRAAIWAAACARASVSSQKLSVLNPWRKREGDLAREFLEFVPARGGGFFKAPDKKRALLSSVYSADSWSRRSSKILRWYHLTF